MRFSLVIVALCLAACATPASVPAAGPAPAPEAQSSAFEQMLHAAGSAEAPSQQVLERAFGAPDVARHDGAGAVSTYRLQSCALLLLFTPDARGEMRLAEAHVSARRASEATPSLEQCAAEASARGAGS